MNSIKHFPEQQTFTLFQNAAEAGRLKYGVSDGLWNMTGTVIGFAFRSQGLARIVANAAIAEPEQHGTALAADCSYAAAVLADIKHQPQAV